MPTRFSPSAPGFLDSLVYFYGVGYILHGIVWFVLRTPSNATAIPWLNGFFLNENIGAWFLITGALVLSIRLLWTGRMSLTICLAVAVFAGMFPGMLFSAAWAFGFYPRGLVTASMYLLVAAVLWWTTHISYRNAEKERKALDTMWEV